MSSTFRQAFMTPIPGKDRETNMEKDPNVRRRKRDDSDVAGTPRKKIKGCNFTHCAEPFKVQEDISVRKRRAGDDGKMPGKKMRPSEVSVADFTKQSVKRKASVDAGTSEKKMRRSSNSTNSSEKRKASDDGDAPEEKMSCRDTTCPTESSSTGSIKKVLTEGKHNISYICDNASLAEEKILKMASSLHKSRAEFEHEYLQLDPIGSGGFGSVYAGFRKVDCLPVAIKHIPSRMVRCERVLCNGKVYNVILEVALMLKTARLPGSVRKSATISLLDWYTLEEELILVLERPAFSMDLFKYLEIKRGSLPEDEAKMILKQLVDAAIDMHAKGVFHRDIKLENILIHRSTSGAPRLRVIDFGCSTFSTEMSYSSFAGTFAFAPPEWLDHRTYWARPTTVWQLGALFYSLLHEGEYCTTMGFICNDIQINSALSRDSKILLHMCLARDPKERATLEELQCCPAFRQPRPPRT